MDSTGPSPGNMFNDTGLPLEEIEPDPSVLKDTLVPIAGHVKGRDEENLWTRSLRVLMPSSKRHLQSSHPDDSANGYDSGANDG